MDTMFFKNYFHHCPGPWIDSRFSWWHSKAWFRYSTYTKASSESQFTSIIKGHCRFHIIAMSYIRIVAAVFHDGHLRLCIGYNLYRFNRNLNVLPLRVLNDHLIHNILIKER